jgi:hypothetical protein
MFHLDILFPMFFALMLIITNLDKWGNNYKDLVWKIKEIDEYTIHLRVILKKNKYQAKNLLD